MNKDLYIKLENAKKILPKYKITDSFFLLADSEGWSDGYIADCIGLHNKEIEAEIALKNIKKPLLRYTTDKEQCPHIKSLIVDGGLEVDNMEWDLTDNKIVLFTPTTKAKIDPRLLNYFTTNYDITKIVVVEDRKPVKLYTMQDGNDIFIGLLMPILY